MTETNVTVKAEGGSLRVRYEIPPWVDPKSVPKIFPAMIAANRGIEAVSKSRKNAQQGYSFRGIDQVYDMVHSVLAEAGVITIPRVLERKTHDRQTKAGGGMVLVEMHLEYWCYAEDGSALVIGPLWSEALDSSDKASNKCMSFGQKYALLQTFTIPTSDVSEGDRETHDRGQQAPQQQAPPQGTGGSTGAPESEKIGQVTAEKVYTAFGELGVTRAQLIKRMGVEVAAAPMHRLDELKGWRDEVSRDRKAAARIFGSSGTGERVLDINNRISNNAPHPQEGPPQ